MKAINWIIILIFLLSSYRIHEFAVNENGIIYRCKPVGSVIVDSSIAGNNILKITVIGKKGQYSYEIKDVQGNIMKSGKYEKTHIVRTRGEKEDPNGGPVIVCRSRYYEPDVTQ